METLRVLLELDKEQLLALQQGGKGREEGAIRIDIMDRDILGEDELLTRSTLVLKGHMPYVLCFL